jgi:hypothetical protein
MHVKYRNVNHALYRLPQIVMDDGVAENTRNGPVTTLLDPIIVTTLEPQERVLLCPKRRANPFLFLLDGLSILSEVRKVRPFSDIVPRFLNYSDDGENLRAHYGRRLSPQLGLACALLLENPSSRQVTMSIWRPAEDLGADSKDIPCNVHVNLRVVGSELDLTVFNRSNDLFWGMLGANIVQFSFLQEYIASRIGVGIGRLHQVSTNLHIYTSFGPGMSETQAWSPPPVEYPPVIPLNAEMLRPELNVLFSSLAAGDLPSASPNSFVEHVVLPMLRAQREKSPRGLANYPDCDWFHAARMFLEG